MLAMIVIACIASIALVGQSTLASYQDSAQKMEAVFP